MKKNKKGAIIIISLVVIGILMLISSYFLNSIITENKISRSIESSSIAYYLAESGVNEAIWKLNNDNSWRENFVSELLNPDVNGNYWSDSFSRENIDGGSYFVTIQNNSRGYAEIVSTSEVLFFGKKVRKKIKTFVFRGFGSPTENAGILTGGSGQNIQISHSLVRINNGNLFSNNNLVVSGNTILEVYDDKTTSELEGGIFAYRNILLQGNAEIRESTMICSKNQCSADCEKCPPEEIPPPVVDFYSESQYSFKERAISDENCEIVCKKKNQEPYTCSNECLVTSSDFSDLLWEVGEEGTLILNNKVTYVLGHMNLRGGKTIEINGVLIVDGNVDIGTNYSWNKMGQKSEGFSHIIINRVGPKKASGLLATGKIDFGEYSLREESNIVGVIYALQAINMTSIPKKLVIRGALIGRQVSVTSLLEGLEVNLDNEVIMYGLGYIIDGDIIVPFFSPTIQVDHWEEVY